MLKIMENTETRTLNNQTATDPSMKVSDSYLWKGKRLFWNCKTWWDFSICNTKNVGEAVCLSEPDSN